jgi:glutamine transport system substrate-binding protein
MRKSRFMKKLVGAGLTMVLSLTILSGCGNSSSDETSSSSGADTKSEATGSVEGALKGVTLQVGTDTSFVPFCFPDDNNEYTGFDIELLQKLSEYLGFEYKLQPMDFTALLMSVQTNKLDMGMAGITITDERKEVMDFAEPYYDAGLLILVSEDNTEIKSIADLEGKKIALKEGTASVDYVKENVSDSKVTTFPNIETAYLEVQRGIADAVVYDAPNMKYYIQQNPDCQSKVVGELVDGCQYGIVLQKESKYTKYISKAVKTFKEDGTYDAIYEKWFGSEN